VSQHGHAVSSSKEEEKSELFISSELEQLKEELPVEKELSMQ